MTRREYRYGAVCEVMHSLQSLLRTRIVEGDHMLLQISNAVAVTTSVTTPPRIASAVVPTRYT